MPKVFNRIRKNAKRAVRALNAERIARQRHRPIRPEAVLYESFAGNGMLCNPEAIFRYLLHHPDFAHLNHIWAISDAAATRAFQQEFKGHRRVSFVVRESGNYWAALSTSGYLINNATFPTAFGKRAGQVYLNTWHGTPMKRMGFDVPDGARQSANTLRNFLSADYLLAANDFMASEMYERAYRLTNIFQGEIIEEGYPRVDAQRLTPEQRNVLNVELGELGLHTAGKRVLLYAPTWRGTNFGGPSEGLDSLASHVIRMTQALPDETVFLLKVHQSVFADAAVHPGLRDHLVPNTIPSNRVLGLADALIADYSSIFFDYLATSRPIIFFTPDADEYGTDRGTYFNLDELPGTVTTDPEVAVRQALAQIDSAVPHPRYVEWAERFTPHEDGNVTERVVDIVFRDARAGHRVRPVASNGKRRLLLYLGGMRSNGITSSALNLLNQMDYDRFDVTVLTSYTRSEQTRPNLERIDPRARQITRIGGMNGSKVVQLRRRIQDLSEMPPLLPGDARWHSKLWRDEWERIFGGATFDWVADFSGYSPFWANLLLQSPDAPRAIWLHSEMASDRQRTAGGRKTMERGLGHVFNLYRGFDRLVSVSARLTLVNREKLAEYAPPGRFSTVRNFPSPAAIPTGEEQLSDLLLEDETEPAWMTELACSDRETVWFVTVGRLSPEKNHARLLRAFAALHRENSEVRLLIVGGGPLEADLAALIQDLGLHDAAFLAGRRELPVAVLARSDCFVLSSNYEGQPMVLLEAALCGLPIVSTAFASVADALPDDTIHVVQRSDRALTEGMQAFLHGEVPASHLDYEAYVQEVRNELDRVLLATHLDTAQLTTLPQG